jgi:hypothetical protein
MATVPPSDMPKTSNAILAFIKFTPASWNLPRSAYRIALVSRGAK